ncbi:MAG: microcystin degradation protein MlrC [Myxococcota bacterium]|jgi:microcystin degradation protein MlrC
MMRFGRGGKALRIGYGRIFHEACAYSPVSTVESDFRRMHHMVGDELAQAVTRKGGELAGYMPHAELTGFAAAARLAGNITTIPLESSLAIPSGPLTAECFEWLVSGLERRIRDAGPMDGIYLALHGSMQVEGLSEAPEAVILRRVKEAAGSARLAVSYDLHGNLTSGLTDPADVLIAYRSNPHWDLYPTGFRAGNRLIRTLRGEVNPVHAWRKLPMVLGGGMTISFMAPMRQVFRYMAKLERDDKVLSTSLFMVHPYTNSDELGWAVHVSTDGDQGLANELADRLADKAWSQRNVEMPPMNGIDEALDEVSARKRGLGPVSLVDVDDIVGAGAPGGNTRIIQALVGRDRGLTAFVPLHDPEAVRQLWDKPVGHTLDVVLTGTPGYDQPAVSLRATVALCRDTDFGRIVRLDAGSVHIAASERPPLPISPKFWRDLDLNPRKADLIVQKNFFHYRMFYASTSFSHVPVVSAGATSFERVRNREYLRPTHPQVQLEDWRAA